MTIVIKPNSKPIARKAPLSASPVTMPGNASGRITMNAIDSRPKKLWRATARASSEPNARAMAVAPIAASTEVNIAARIPGSLNAWRYQSIVNDWIGQLATFDALNE